MSLRRGLRLAGQGRDQRPHHLEPVAIGVVAQGVVGGHELALRGRHPRRCRRRPPRSSGSQAAPVARGVRPVRARSIRVGLDQGVPDGQHSAGRVAGVLPPVRIVATGAHRLDQAHLLEHRPRPTRPGRRASRPRPRPSGRPRRRPRSRARRWAGARSRADPRWVQHLRQVHAVSPDLADQVATWVVVATADAGASEPDRVGAATGREKRREGGDGAHRGLHAPAA